MRDNVDVLLTEAQAAALLAVTPRCLENWRARKSGPAYVRLPKGVRYRHSVLVAWLAMQTVEPKS